MTILELSDRELKILMSNMLRALMEKVDNMQEHMGKCKQRDGNSKRESRGNS